MMLFVLLVLTVCGATASETEPDIRCKLYKNGNLKINQEGSYCLTNFTERTLRWTSRHTKLDFAFSEHDVFDGTNLGHDVPLVLVSGPSSPSLHTFNTFTETFAPYFSSKTKKNRHTVQNCFSYGVYAYMCAYLKTQTGTSHRIQRIWALDPVDGSGLNRYDADTVISMSDTERTPELNGMSKAHVKITSVPPASPGSSNSISVLYKMFKDNKKYYGVHQTEGDCTLQRLNREFNPFPSRDGQDLEIKINGHTHDPHGILDLKMGDGETWKPYAYRDLGRYMGSLSVNGSPPTSCNGARGSVYTWLEKPVDQIELTFSKDVLLIARLLIISYHWDTERIYKVRPSAVRSKEWTADLRNWMP